MTTSQGFQGRSGPDSTVRLTRCQVLYPVRREDRLFGSGRSVGALPPRGNPPQWSTTAVPTAGANQTGADEVPAWSSVAIAAQNRQWKAAPVITKK